MNVTTEFLTNIRRIIRLYNRMLEPICDKYGMSSVEATVISFLYNNPGKDTAADIVELRMLSKGSVSQAVENLIQKSLLIREQDVEDRRKIHLSLTASAKPITEEIEKIREQFREQIFRGFTAEERELFTLFSIRIGENTKSE